MAATLALLVSTAALDGDAWAQLSCNVAEAVGKPTPAQPALKETGAFRVFWQVSTQIEDLADAESIPGAIDDIREAQKLTDGYFITTLLAGPLVYWPTRPEKCRLNFKRLNKGDSIELDGETFTFEEGGQVGREACFEAQEEFVRSGGPEADTVAEVQLAALDRVFRNLRLSEEQRAGKPIWGSSIIRATEFFYDKANDDVTMKELPNTYCVMNSLGITLNDLMIYQEPRIQLQRDIYLWIPRKNRRGELVYSKNPALDKLPENTHAFDRVTESFVEAGVPTAGFRANLRRWNSKRSPVQVRELLANPVFSGFNFEGGTGILPDGKNVIDNYVEGIAWILTNTQSNVSLVMPGYWSREMVGNDAEIDTLLPRVKLLLTTLNDKLGEAMKLPKGQNAICTSRLTFVVGSYGQPVHVKPLPMRRPSGKLAGTVTGQIKFINDFRKDLCGT